MAKEQGIMEIIKEYPFKNTGMIAVGTIGGYKGSKFISNKVGDLVFDDSKSATRTPDPDATKEAEFHKNREKKLVQVQYAKAGTAIACDIGAIIAMKYFPDEYKPVATGLAIGAIGNTVVKVISIDKVKEMLPDNFKNTLNTLGADEDTVSGEDFSVVNANYSKLYQTFQDLQDKYQKLIDNKGPTVAGQEIDEETYKKHIVETAQKMIDAGLLKGYVDGLGGSDPSKMLEGDKAKPDTMLGNPNEDSDKDDDDDSVNGDMFGDEVEGDPDEML